MEFGMAFLTKIKFLKILNICFPRQDLESKIAWVNPAHLVTILRCDKEWPIYLIDNQHKLTTKVVTLVSLLYNTLNHRIN